MLVDIAVLGAGMAGLSLVYRCLHAGLWKDKKICIIDQVRNRNNDKTWCFWEKSAGPFEELVYKKWSQLSVIANNGESIPLKSQPYVYKMIRSGDFYKHLFDSLSTFPNVTFIFQKVFKVDYDNPRHSIKLERTSLQAEYIFNTIYTQPALGKKDQHFLQHFKGWILKCAHGLSEDHLHLMDFRTSQKHGTTFLYVLPLSKQEIFVEYTLFSQQLLKDSEYTDGLSTFIQNELKIESYDILHEEFGIIPMSSAIKRVRLPNALSLGVAGGDVRPSSGYSFNITQSFISNIIECIKNKQELSSVGEAIPSRHQFYDLLLLTVLSKGKYAGHSIFTDLFKHAKADQVFSFLDAETNFIKEFQIMNTLKSGPFLSELFRLVF